MLFRSPVTPTRALDTRTKAKPVGANSAYELDLDGVAGMPIWGGGRGEVVTGYVITATVTETEAGGLLAAGTGPAVPPATWNLDWSGARPIIGPEDHHGGRPPAMP